MNNKNPLGSYKARLWAMTTHHKKYNCGKFSKSFRNRGKSVFSVRLAKEL